MATVYFVLNHLNVIVIRRKGADFTYFKNRKKSQVLSRAYTIMNQCKNAVR